MLLHADCEVLTAYFVPLPSDAVFQLLNVYPVKLNVDADFVVHVDPYVTDRVEVEFVLLDDTDVKFELYVTVYVFAVHTAYNVKLLVLLHADWVVLTAYVVPLPSDSVFQLLIVYPVKLNADDAFVVHVDPYVTD